MPPCVQYDDLWPGGPRFARSGAGFALGTDSVLLADFAADRRVRRAVLPAGQFDLVVANPPYFAAGSGYTSPNPVRAHARDERTCTMQDICTAMAYLTRWGGSAALVHRPERLSELLCALTAAGLEPKRLRTVARTADAAPSLVLVEARRGGKPGLRILPPLALCAPDGTDSEEIRRIYHRRA